MPAGQRKRLHRQPQDPIRPSGSGSHRFARRRARLDAGRRVDRRAGFGVASSTTSISRTRLPPRSTGSRASNSMSSSTISSMSSSNRTSRREPAPILFARRTTAPRDTAIDRQRPGPKFEARSSRHERSRIRHANARSRSAAALPVARSRQPCPPGRAATTGCFGLTMADGSRLALKYYPVDGSAIAWGRNMRRCHFWRSTASH